MESKQRVTDDFAERQNKIKHIPSITNNEALSLEAELGLSFEGVLPKKVELTESQATSILSKKGKSPGLKQTIVNLVSMIARKRSAAAEYFEEYDTSVVYDKRGGR